MDRLWCQDLLQPPLPPIPVIVGTNWLETAPGPARTMDSGVALHQPVHVHLLQVRFELKQLFFDTPQICFELRQLFL